MIPEINTPAGNNTVQVRMQGKVLAPGVKDGHHSCLGMELCKGKLGYSIPRTGKKHIIEPSGIVQKQPVEHGRQSKDQVKIGYRQKICFTVLYPGLALGILAFGAMTVTAAVITDANMPARVAFINMTSQSSGTTPEQCSESTFYVGIGGMLIVKFLTEAFDYPGQFEGWFHDLAYNLSSGLNRLVRSGFATCR